MWLLGAFFFLGCAGAALLAPLVAAVLVYLSSKPRPSPIASWLGLTIVGELGVAFPLYALSVGVQGYTHWGYYHAAHGFAVAGAVVAFFAGKEHWRRLRGERAGAGIVGLGCLGLAALVAVVLMPRILGAPLPFGGGWFGQELTFAGDADDYVRAVPLFALAMVVEAWLLRGWGRERAPAAGAVREWAIPLGSLAVAGLVLGAITILPRSRWDSRHVAKLERSALRREAENLDVPRRRELAEIVAGRAPRLLGSPCPEELIPESWREWRRFANVPKDWEEIVRQGSVWSYQKAVDLWLPNQPADSELAGPRRFNAFFYFDDKEWTSPWPEKDFLVAPAEARRRVRSSVGFLSWEVDATLVVSDETLSTGPGKTSLGSLDGSLWVWSYREQAFICAGEAHIPRTAIDVEIASYQDPIVRSSIRARALALALGALRAVERKP